MWYVFDALEIIMGPYATKQQAEGDMSLHIKELYLLDYYPNPYVDFIEEDENDVTSCIVRTRDFRELLDVTLRLMGNMSQTRLSKDRKEMRKQLREVFERSKSERN